MDIQRIPLAGCKNTRDFGGFPTKDGRHIKPHRLLRSCELYVTTENDRKELMQTYDLKKVLDFRTAKEREEHPDPEMPGVINLHMPVLDEKALGVTREGQDGDFLEQLAASVMAPALMPPGICRVFMKKSFSVIMPPDSIVVCLMNCCPRRRARPSGIVRQEKTGPELLRFLC